MNPIKDTPEERQRLDYPHQPNTAVVVVKSPLQEHMAKILGASDLSRLSLVADNPTTISSRQRGGGQSSRTLSRVSHSFNGFQQFHHHDKATSRWAACSELSSSSSTSTSSLPRVDFSPNKAFQMKRSLMNEFVGRPDGEPGRIGKYTFDSSLVLSSPQASNCHSPPRKPSRSPESPRKQTSSRALGEKPSIAKAIITMDSQSKLEGTRNHHNQQSPASKSSSSSSSPLSSQLPSVAADMMSNALMVMAPSSSPINSKQLQESYVATPLYRHSSDSMLIRPERRRSSSSMSSEEAVTAAAALVSSTT